MNTYTQSNQRAAGQLEEYIRMVLAFFCCLAVLSVYQHLHLFLLGILDTVFNKSLLLLLLHHAGYVALTGFFLAFVFRALESRKAGLGKKTLRLVFLALLMAEGMLTVYYVNHFEPFRLPVSDLNLVSDIVLPGIVFPGFSVLLFNGFIKLMIRVYGPISKMFPFTIILFSLFLATQMVARSPVNENKTQLLMEQLAGEFLEFNSYEGAVEYPLARPFKANAGLASHFALKEKPPHLVIVIIDGLGHELTGQEAAIGGFTPFLDSLEAQSLSWKNFLSNSTAARAAIPSLLGSLPFGKTVFPELDHFVHRQTLYGVLKDNGYHTAFHYGGNTALYQWDRFLAEEQVDQILDFKGFGPSYQKQDADAAGNSQGYPDKELFRHWEAHKRSYAMPRLDVFVTLSSKRPFNIPLQEAYLRLADQAVAARDRGRKARELIRRNRQFLASLRYTDDALRNFFQSYRHHPEYQNTLFLITGSHNPPEFAGESTLNQFRVPLLIFSPMLRRPERLHSLASHMDVLPSILGLLEASYPMQIPKQVSWLGTGLIHEGTFKKGKTIPLQGSGYRLNDFLSGSYLLSDGTAYELDASLQVRSAKGDEIMTRKIGEEFLRFKAVHAYVTRDDKLVPPEDRLFPVAQPLPAMEERVWLESVFNGENFDNAFKTARELALQGNHERALLLCRHILSKVPGHVDTEILQGRIYGWTGRYQEAAVTLNGVIQKYPVYTDGYAALLDLYDWSGQHERAWELKPLLESNGVKSPELDSKIQRALLKRQQERFSEPVPTGKLKAAALAGPNEGWNP